MSNSKVIPMPSTDLGTSSPEPVATPTPNSLDGFPHEGKKGCRARRSGSDEYHPANLDRLHSVGQRSSDESRRTLYPCTTP